MATRGTVGPKWTPNARRLRRPDQTLATYGSGIAQFCSMKITQDVRDYAARQKEIEAGMADKSAEFRERGAEVYLPVGVVAGDAKEPVAAH